MSNPVSTDARLTHEERYEEWRASIRTRFDLVTNGVTTLFTTSATDLFETFLANLPEDRRQHYNCKSCRRFFEKFGGLVVLDANGDQTPVFWNVEQTSTPTFFLQAAGALHDKVRRARVTGVFLTNDSIWGIPETDDKKGRGKWWHTSVIPDPRFIARRSRTKEQHEVVAEKLADFQILLQSLKDYPVEAAREAYNALSTGNLYRSEKALAIAKWFFELHTARAEATGQRQHNVLWYAVGHAPPGFTHVRSTIISTLLDDIVAGVAFPEIQRKWNAKLHPLQYQRPQAAPTSGAIERAEKLVAELGLAPSLKRRFAKLEDVIEHAIWVPHTRPEPTKEGEGGVFGHLKPKDKPEVKPVEQPAVSITMEKFRRSVLPEAEAIEFYADSRLGPYIALVTAVDPTAPPILQWDLETKRNPVSHYVYTGGSPPDRWNLRAGTFVPVTAIVPSAHMWGGEDLFKHQAKGINFLLQGARDVDYRSSGGFFPETLKNELREVRSTLEAYARSAVIEGKDEASACGVVFTQGTEAKLTFRVKTPLGIQLYKIDRWD